MKRKGRLQLGILFGGKSAEHEVSIVSAKHIARATDQRKYDIIPIGVDRAGEWVHVPTERLLSEGFDESSVFANLKRHTFFEACHHLCSSLDVIFPVFHGPFGEDGAMQGFFQVANIPFVGSGVLASAIGMDKDVMKRLLRAANLPVGDFLIMRKKGEFTYTEAKKHLGKEIFIKPANMGSSVGLSVVKNQEEFNVAVGKAFTYDEKIILERKIQAREFEMSVLGDSDLAVSLPGEVIPKGGVYTYDAKYVDEDGAQFITPAKLEMEIIIEMQSIAKKAFRMLCTESMARIDFFLDKQQRIYVNEINTIPGFTPISLYPKLWEYSGISYPELIDRLIVLALEKHKRKSAISTQHDGTRKVHC